MKRRLATGTTCLVLLLIVGCGASQRARAVHQAVVVTNALRDGFVVWDRQHQTSLVEKAANREAALEALAKYQAERAVVERGFEVVYRALAVAATQTDDLSFTAALESSVELNKAVQAFMKGR